jgi:hypothetical protein
MNNIAKQSAVLITWFHFFKKGARPQKSAYELVGARQIIQCVGQIKIGSSAQALYQTPNFRRHGKPNGIMPVWSYQVRQLPNRNHPARVGSVATAEPDTTSLRA